MQEKAAYLAQWDYGAESEHADAMLDKQALFEATHGPFSMRDVVEVNGTSYLLVEQYGAGAALFRTPLR